MKFEEGNTVMLRPGCPGYPPYVRPGIQYRVGGLFHVKASKDKYVGIIREDGKSDMWYADHFQLVEGPW